MQIGINLQLTYDDQSEAGKAKAVAALFHVLAAAATTGDGGEKGVIADISGGVKTPVAPDPAPPAEAAPAPVKPAKAKKAAKAEPTAAEMAAALTPVEPAPAATFPRVE